MYISKAALKSDDTPDEPKSNISILGQFKGCSIKCDDCGVIVDAEFMVENGYGLCIGCCGKVFKVLWSDGVISCYIRIPNGRKVDILESDEVVFRTTQARFNIIHGRNNKG